MLTYNDVYLAPLDKLANAMHDWSTMATKLAALATTAHTTMAAKAKDEYWVGSNADITKPFIDKTAKEFSDAAKEAKGIHEIISEAYTAFKMAKDDLQKLIDHDAPSQGLMIGAHGKVVAQYPVEDNNGARHDPDFSELYGKQQSRIQALQKRVDAIVETCDDADISASNALKADVTSDRHQFSKPVYNSLDAEKVHRAVALARKGADLTHTQLLQLNELLKDNSKSREFSRGFYDGIGGPKKALEFFGELSTDTYDGSKQDKQRLKDVQALQKDMGLTLAAATNPAGPKDQWPDHWSEEMRKLGTQRIPLHAGDYNGPYGYQLLGGIMRYGNYDPKFLNPIAEHVVQLHAKNPYMFADSKSDLGYDKFPFNPSGKDGAGYDPVTSVLEALGHSPEASQQFFSEDPQTYNADGVLRGGLPTDGDGKQISSYLDYFENKDYKSFPDIVGHDPDEAAKSVNNIPDAFGHALESATLGHAYDDQHASLVRSAAGSHIMEKVVQTYGGDAGLLKSQAALSDSLGRMGASYVDDLSWALDQNNDPGSVFAPKGNWDAHAEFGEDNARKFLSSLGQHPDAYSTVSDASRVYSSSVLEAQVGSDGVIDRAGAHEAVRTGALIQGILDQSRADQIGAEGGKVADDYNSAMEKKSGWIELGTGAAIGVGAAFLPISAPVAGVAAVLVPLAMENGQGVVEQYAGQLVGDWSDASSDKWSDDHTERIHQAQNAVYTAGRENVQVPLQLFKDNHGLPLKDSVIQELISTVNEGYNNGNSEERQEGNRPQTG
ncbi:hypothetical protein [Streptomyces sp. NBC_01497]|uniref:hypothetical protein n=1 Tax=Streptomyces sp. NBC_01497 TaxID=2903885 RepID=UPI002E303547|nr:hypothetical protein [Streptomyces sp. NBC_01497]